MGKEKSPTPQQFYPIHMKSKASAAGKIAGGKDHAKILEVLKKHQNLEKPFKISQPK